MVIGKRRSQDKRGLNLVRVIVVTLIYVVYLEVNFALDENSNHLYNRIHLCYNSNRYCVKVLTHFCHRAIVSLLTIVIMQGLVVSLDVTSGAVSIYIPLQRALHSCGHKIRSYEVVKRLSRLF